MGFMAALANAAGKKKKGKHAPKKGRPMPKGKRKPMPQDDDDQEMEGGKQGKPRGFALAISINAGKMGKHAQDGKKGGKPPMPAIGKDDGEEEEEEER